MKSPIVFRAHFRQPKGPLNPMHLPMPGTIEVEIYQARSKPPQEWKARKPGSKLDFKIIAQGTPQVLMSMLELHHFEERMSEWEAYDTTWTPAKLLQRSEWKLCSDGQVMYTEHGAEMKKERLGKTA